jgi:hypothetical protein
MKRSVQCPTDSCEDSFRRRYSLSMNGTPSRSGNSGIGPNAEDLDGVLGRFQDWAKTRRDQPTSKYSSTAGIDRGAASRKANLGGGVREPSYEQALRASSYRRPASPDATEVPPQATKPPPHAKSQAELPELDSTTSRYHATAGTANPVRALAPTTIASADSRTVKANRSKASGAEMGLPVASTPRSRTAATKSQVRSSNRSPPRLTCLDPAVAAVSSSPEVTRPQASTQAAKPQRIQPAFREVPKGTAGLATTASAVLDAKSIALSLRVSNAEQARIRASAGRANLSVSAYLRQCAIGVDDLRDQVELALTKRRQQETNAAAPPGLSAIPGILGRFGRHWFQRLSGHHDYTAISLR